MKNLVIRLHIIKRIIKISVYGISQFLLSTSSWLLLIKIIAMFGSAPIAAYTITLRLMEFVWLPVWGLGNAAATLVGQNLGANRADRAIRSVKLTAKYSLYFMIIFGVLQFIFASQIMNLFSDNQDVINYGINCLKIIACGYPALAIGMIIVQSLNGAGDIKSPAIINFLSYWVIQIPLAYFLSVHTDLMGNGVFISILVAEIILAILAYLVFQKSKWQEVNI